MGERDRPLRIALLTYRGNMFCGGQGIYAVNLARALAARGHEVRLLSGPPYPEPAEGVEIIRLPDENFINRPAAHLPRPNPLAVFTPLNFLEYSLARAGANPEMLAFSFRAFHFLTQKAEGLRLDVVHDNQSLGYGLLLLQARGVPVVATIHHPLQVDRREDLRQMSGMIPQMKRALYYPLLMQKIVARRLKRVISVSRFSAELITRTYGLEQSRVAVAANGVDTKIFRPLAETRRESGRILFVGSTEDRKKGIRFLLEALLLLPPLFRLTIVDGRRYPGRVYAVELAKRLGLQPRVEFKDRISTTELVREYNQAEMVVIPSLFEGFGLPALEAMACGAPLVCTTAGALPEVVSPECAILVPPRHPQAVARAVRDLHADPERRRQMGEAGRRRALQHFSWQAAAAAVEFQYRLVLEKQRRGRPSFTSGS